MYGLRLITPPAQEPLTVFEVMEHLRLDQPDDAFLTALIRTAREDLDGREGRLKGVTLITQTWEMLLDSFPTREIRLPLWPLQTVDSIKYDDQSGLEQTVPSTDYIVDTASHRPRIALAPDKSWPGTRNAINAVRIRFTAGYGTNANAIPYFFRQAMLLLIGHLYGHRGDGAPIDPPPAYFTLLGVR